MHDVVAVCAQWVDEEREYKMACDALKIENTAQWRAKNAARRPLMDNSLASVLTGARKALRAAGHAWWADFADVRLSAANIIRRGALRSGRLWLPRVSNDSYEYEKVASNINNIDISRPKLLFVIGMLSLL